jgi:hypothetical protein
VFAVLSEAEFAVPMSRWLTWIAEKNSHGWGCSQCQWIFELPSLLSDPEARKAYDRLAASRFHDHECSSYAEKKPAKDGPNLTERARKLVMRGFKPRDAVDVALQEITLEYRSDLQAMTQAKQDAEDFLRRVKEGLI